LTNTLIDFKNSLFFDFAAKTVSSIWGIASLAKVQASLNSILEKFKNT
jgi:hypothetical protein